ncbi:unnamed protein product [Mycena citricolor]|uniref:Uncharacterized protein n=1 Tax=Mycena citricolor TaxID=2018698 RepID=A0AAD2HEV8_9AGAR|nr:unnamed protein product [Mycena citricolor]
MDAIHFHPNRVERVARARVVSHLLCTGDCSFHHNWEHGRQETAELARVGGVTSNVIIFCRRLLFTNSNTLYSITYYSICVVTAPL